VNLWPTGARQLGEVRGKSFAKNGNRGLKSTASSLLSAAFLWNDHTGVRTKPFRAADEKIPLSVVLVKKKPQYLVFCYHSGHLLAKQRQLPVESRKRPCGARIPAVRSAPNPVHTQVSRPVPVPYTSLALAVSHAQDAGTVQVGGEAVRVVEITAISVWVEWRPGNPERLLPLRTPQRRVMVAGKEGKAACRAAGNGLRGASEAFVPLGQFVGDGQIQILVDAVEEQADRGSQESGAADDLGDQADAQQCMARLHAAGLIAKEGE
jgi:hypothetical protein